MRSKIAFPYNEQGEGLEQRDPMGMTGFILRLQQQYAAARQQLQQARHDSPEAQPRIGEGSGILHPDTPWNWRPGHQNHFHFEVAKVK